MLAITPLSAKSCIQERKKKGETNTQVFLADVFAYQVNCSPVFDTKGGISHPKSTLINLQAYIAVTHTLY